MRKFSYQNILLIFTSLIQIAVWLLLSVFLILLVRDQFSAFGKWYFSFYASHSQNLIWDFLKTKWLSLLVEGALLGFSSFLAFDHLICFSKNLGALERVERRPSKIEHFLLQLVRSFLHSGLFPKNYLAWGLLYLMIEVLRPKTFLEATIDHSSRNMLIFVLSVVPPFLLLLDSYSAARKFRNTMLLVFSMVVSCLIYFALMRSASQVGGEWALSFLLPYGLFFIFVPISLLYGIFLLKSDQ